MSNPIKYSIGSESLALKTGNFYIGTGDVGKGPTSTTGYYNGITPPSGGYTIYLNKATGGPSIYTCANDTELISLTNSIAGTSYTTANECLTYFTGQSDKVCFNRDYEGIVTDGLIFNVDAGFTPSYPKNGTTWYDLSKNNDGALINGPTYSSDGGGSIVFDGSDDAIETSSVSDFNFYQKDFTIEIVIYGDVGDSSANTYRGFLGFVNTSNTRQYFLGGLRSRLTGIAGLYSYNTTPNGTQRGFITTPYQDYIYGGTTYTYPGNWTYLTHIFSYTDNKQYFYVNGSYYAQTTYASFTNSNNYIEIGTDNSKAKGKIPIVRLYDKQLSADEILQNFNAQKGRFGL